MSECKGPGLSVGPLTLGGVGAVGTSERSLGREQPTVAKEAWGRGCPGWQTWETERGAMSCVRAAKRPKEMRTRN